MRWTTFLLLTILTLPLFSQNNTQGEIRGTYVDETGKAILRNVRITVLSTGDTTRTDSSGKFHIVAPAGIAHLAYSVNGFQSDTIDIVVAAGKTTYVTIKLQPVEPEKKRRRFEVFNRKTTLAAQDRNSALRLQLLTAKYSIATTDFSIRYL